MKAHLIFDAEWKVAHLSLNFTLIRRGSSIESWLTRPRILAGSICLSRLVSSKESPGMRIQNFETIYEINRK